MNHLTRLLKTYDYHNLEAFGLSLAPSGRYSVTVCLLTMSFTWSTIDRVFGLDQAGFVALVLIFPTELITGIWASIVRGEKFKSAKLSRFGLKMACYLIMIGVTYCLSTSFTSHNEDVAAWAFNWLHTALVAQVGFENVVSILENISSINGKENDAIIVKITDKFKSIF